MPETEVEKREVRASAGALPGTIAGWRQAARGCDEAAGFPPQEAHKEAHEKKEEHEKKEDDEHHHGPCEPVGGALKGAFDAVGHGIHEARSCRTGRPAAPLSFYFILPRSTA